MFSKIKRTFHKFIKSNTIQPFNLNDQDGHKWHYRSQYAASMVHDYIEEKEYALNSLKVLDLGAGNMKFRTYLENVCPHFEYIPVDLHPQSKHVAFFDLMADDSHLELTPDITVVLGVADYYLSDLQSFMKRISRLGSNLTLVSFVDKEQMITIDSFEDIVHLFPCCDLKVFHAQKAQTSMLKIARLKE